MARSVLDQHIEEARKLSAHFTLQAHLVLTAPLGSERREKEKELLKKSLELDAALVRLRGNDQERRKGKPEPPPDPYGGKVLEDGMIEYMARAGNTVVVDPKGRFEGLGRGDIVLSPHNGKGPATVLGTGEDCDGDTVLWLQWEKKEVGLSRKGTMRTVISRANPQEIRLEPAPEPRLVLTATSLWSNPITEGGYPCPTSK